MLIRVVIKEAAGVSNAEVILDKIESISAARIEKGRKAPLGDRHQNQIEHARPDLALDVNQVRNCKGSRCVECRSHN